MASPSKPLEKTLKPSIRSALEQDYAAATEALTNPNMSPYIQDKAALRRQASQMKKTLDDQAPKQYESGQELDAAVKQERTLREKFLEGMPTKQEMRRNREGSVHKHMSWEKANKARILEWREVVKRINHDSTDPDLTNYERYRPDQTFGLDTTSQIPGHHAMSEQAKDNWPDEMAEPKAKTAVSHLRKR